MSFIELEIKGLDKLGKLADKYPRVSEKHVNFAIKKSLAIIEGHVAAEAPVGYTRRLRDVWITTLGRFQGSLRSGVTYASAVEYGTRPHQVPIDELFAGWAAKKGLNPYAVAKSIAKKGTTANPFFSRGIGKARGIVEKTLQRAVGDILKEITQ